MARKTIIIIRCDGDGCRNYGEVAELNDTPEVHIFAAPMTRIQLLAYCQTAQRMGASLALAYRVVHERQPSLSRADFRGLWWTAKSTSQVWPNPTLKVIDK